MDQTGKGTLLKHKVLNVRVKLIHSCLHYLRFLQRLLHSLTYKPQHLRFCLALTMTENSYDLSHRNQQTLNCTQAGAHTPCFQVLIELQNTRENTWEVFSITSSLRVKGGRWYLPCLLYILPIWDDFLKLVIQLSKWGGEGNKTISSRSQGLVKLGRLLFHLLWLSAISQCSWCVHMCTIPPYA